MSRDNIIPLHSGHLSPAERAFDRDLRAERDALHRAYDIRPDLYRSLDERARMAEPPLDAFAEESECVEDMTGDWSWPSAMAGGIVGFLTGMLAVLIPALIVAWVVR
jgi:hypothetical protein